jgi:anti-sigma B factor antagonist
MTNKNKFFLQNKNINDIDIINVAGYLDAHTAPELEDAISNLVSKGRYKIIVNFKDLDYISSAGLGVFMAFIEDVRYNGGDIKFSSMKPKVFSVFDLLGFPLLFDIVEKEDDAIIRFGKEKKSEDV